MSVDCTGEERRTTDTQIILTRTNEKGVQGQRIPLSKPLQEYENGKDPMVNTPRANLTIFIPTSEVAI